MTSTTPYWIFGRVTINGTPTAGKTVKCKNLTKNSTEYTLQSTSTGNYGFDLFRFDTGYDVGDSIRVQLWETVVQQERTTTVLTGVSGERLDLAYVTTTKTRSGDAHIIRPGVTATRSGDAFVKVITAKTVSGNSHICIQGSPRMVSGNAYISAGRTSSIAGNARLVARGQTKTVAGNATITVPGTAKFLSGNARLLASGQTKIVSGNAYVAGAVTSTRTISGNSRLLALGQTVAVAANAYLKGAMTSKIVIGNAFVGSETCLMLNFVIYGEKGSVNLISGIGPLEELVGAA